jgi:hypothetical protein
MKNFKIYSFITVLIALAACEEKADVLTKQGPFASFYESNTAIVSEIDEELITITIESSGVLNEQSFAYVKIPSDPSIVTEPAYDPFSKLLAVPIESVEVDNQDRFFGTFTFQYKNNDSVQTQSIFPLTIEEVDGSLNGVVNNVYEIAVIDDDLFSEDFNNTCSVGAEVPLGWTVYSVASDFTWGCSGSNRGASGEEGDYAFEMNNFGSPNNEPANDWLITPALNISSSTGKLVFESMMRYEGSTLRVYYSENYVPGENPENYNWIEIEEASSAVDNDFNSFDFVKSTNTDTGEDIDISNLPDDVYIGFHYTSVGTASGESAIARIDNLEIK